MPLRDSSSRHFERHLMDSSRHSIRHLMGNSRYSMTRILLAIDNNCRRPVRTSWMTMPPAILWLVLTKCLALRPPCLMKAFTPSRWQVVTMRQPKPDLPWYKLPNRQGYLRGNRGWKRRRREVPPPGLLYLPKNRPTPTTLMRAKMSLPAREEK